MTEIWDLEYSSCWSPWMFECFKGFKQVQTSNHQVDQQDMEQTEHNHRSGSPSIRKHREKMFDSLEFIKIHSASKHLNLSFTTGHHSPTGHPPLSQ